MPDVTKLVAIREALDDYFGDEALTDKVLWFISAIKQREPFYAMIKEIEGATPQESLDYPGIVFNGRHVKYVETTQLNNMSGFMILYNSQYTITMAANLSRDQKIMGLKYLLNKIVDSPKNGVHIWNPIKNNPV